MFIFNLEIIFREAEKNKRSQCLIANIFNKISTKTDIEETIMTKAKD